MPRYLVAVVVGLFVAFATPAVAAPGSISGHVQDVTGDPLVAICVRAHAPVVADPFAGPYVLTNDHGDYEITGLDPGTYKVVFYDLSAKCAEGIDFYFTQWFDNKPDQGSADLVTVNDGAATTGINATMGEPEAIVGRVTDVDGQPAAVCVEVVPVGPGPSAATETDSDGYYVARVPAGTYKVHFYDRGTCSFGQYVDEWYNDKPDLASADVVEVKPAHATFGIDAVMYDFPSISGHVQDESGEPIAGVCVVANKAHVLNPPSFVPPIGISNARGNYYMDIPPGDWSLQFYDGGIPCTATSMWQLQYYNGKYVFDEADVLHLERGTHIAGINATMKLRTTTTTTPPPPPPPPPAVTCHVPKLRGLTLARAKRLLHKNHCAVGKITRRHSKKRQVGHVLASKPRAGVVRPSGTKVALVLGKRR
jgi:hypothetical protein